MAAGGFADGDAGGAGWPRIAPNRFGYGYGYGFEGGGGAPAAAPILAQGWGDVEGLQGVRTDHTDAIADYEAWLGRGADFALAFANGSTWSNLIDYAEVQAALWGATHPIAWSVGIAGDATLAEVAAGTHDAHLIELADLFLATRPADDMIIIRPLWEAQLADNAWDAYGNEADYIAAFRKITQIFLGRSTKFRFDWCVNQTTERGGSPYDPALFYPGDDYVDVIGQDVYYILDYGGGSGDDADPVTAFRLKQSDDFGLNWLTAFARTHAKPISVPEWGTDSDDAEGFISLMFEFFRAGNTAYSAYYDEDGTWPTKLSGGALPATATRYIVDYDAPTNLLAAPADLSSGSWTRTGIGTILEAQADPFGGTTAEGLPETAATSEHTAYQDYTKGTGLNRYRASFIVAPIGARSHAIVKLFGDSFGDGAVAWFDLAAANVATSFPYGDITIDHSFAIPLEDGFVKIGFEALTSAATDLQLRIMAASADNVDSYAGDIAKGLTVCGATLRRVENALLDTFTGSDTTNLSAHAADSGEAWTATAGAVLINGNKVYPSTVTALYRSAWEPPTAEYDVEAQIEFKTILNQAVYVVARCADASNFYYAGKHATTHKWVLGKCVAGSFTELGTSAEGPSGGTTYTLRLEVLDGTKAMFVNDVQILQSADNALTGAGRPGIRAASVASTTTTGAHYDRFAAGRP